MKTDSFCFTKYIQLEIDLLAQTGYQIGLDKCVVTGELDNLCYVSPKSGQAVSQKIGEEYANKLLVLPQFFRQNREALPEEKQQAFTLTSYFLNRYILHGKVLREREALIEICQHTWY